jgi:serine/threonine protein kinase
MFIFLELWVAPEHLRYPSITTASKKGDVYSFAIIIHEVITRAAPFDYSDECLDTEGKNANYNYHDYML